MQLLKSLIYYIAIGFLLLYIFLVVVSPEKMMDVIGFRAFVVLSDSMEPKINVNDLIISKRVDESSLEVGDIITFDVYINDLGGLATVTHYIGEIDNSNTKTIYKTRGEKLPAGTFDSWKDKNGDPFDITFDDIEGRYIFKIPYAGYIQNALADRKLVTLILINGAVIYLLIKYLKSGKEDETY